MVSLSHRLHDLLPVAQDIEYGMRFHAAIPMGYMLGAPVSVEHRFTVVHELIEALAVALVTTQLFQSQCPLLRLTALCKKLAAIKRLSSIVRTVQITNSRT